MKEIVAGSFRDPSGFLFRNKGTLYRQINKCFQQEYDLFMTNGLYQSLVDKNWIIQHSQAKEVTAYDSESAYTVIRPNVIPYITYPYEWSFSQYKKAALLTLDICIEALEYSMILKDASAYNIQFVGCDPIMIDTLSFQKYKEGNIWDGYGQFCRHFLAPILLMSKSDIRLSRLMSVYIDGIPLDMAAQLLPRGQMLSFSSYMHIYLHAKQKSSKNLSSKVRNASLSKQALKAILNNLRSLITKCKLSSFKSDWGQYYVNMHNYTTQASESKKNIVRDFLERCNATNICDMAGNYGEYSKIAAERLGSYVVCYDLDYNAIEAQYQHLLELKVKNILPLILDLTNPSPAIGWNNEERDSVFTRCNWDCVMALALIHHLSISNNLPFANTAIFFARLSKYLIIEFIPKSDSQVQLLLQHRKDIFESYNQDYFEKTYLELFVILEKKQICDSGRVLYLMERRSS